MYRGDANVEAVVPVHEVVVVHVPLDICDLRIRDGEDNLHIPVEEVRSLAEDNASEPPRVYLDHLLAIYGVEDNFLRILVVEVHS